MISNKWIIGLAAILLLTFSACGPKPMAPKAELDTPEHHVANGNKLLKTGKLEGAFAEFNRAKELDPKHSPAYLGMGVVYGLQGNFEKGFEELKTADRYANGDAEKLNVDVGYMRLYLAGKEAIDENWLRRVENAYRDAVRIDDQRPEPYYYMGLGYKDSYEFRKAAAEFTRVLDLNKDLAAEADKEYAVIQRIERAMPGTKVGKKIALLDEITRADVAALFIEELEIDEIFRRRMPRTYDTAFKSPEKNFQSGQYVKAPPATDIEDHVLKTDIDAVIELGIKGLQPFPDHTYRPYQPITRAEFAMMIEDILIKITRDDSLATQFIGSPSPFPDLRSDLPYFNSVMVCTTRGIMETTDPGTGEFQPMKQVTGADALLSIRTLKNQVDKF
jgi:tetratricopeptide (TPR) repeat protein